MKQIFEPIYRFKIVYIGQICKDNIVELIHNARPDGT